MSFELRREKTGLRGFRNRSDTNRHVQSQKQVRTLKFWAEVEEELLYLSWENKGLIRSAVQLHDSLVWYCQFDVSPVNYSDSDSDLRLCFCLGQNQVFSWPGSFSSIT